MFLTCFSLYLITAIGREGGRERERDPSRQSAYSTWEIHRHVRTVYVRERRHGREDRERERDK